MDKRTPLYDAHVAAGGKMVSFAGYLLPVQYAGVIEEHMAVRRRAGLFDVSHMGELLLTGPDALANLERLLPNRFTGMADGRVRYSPVLNRDGGVIDDVLVYRLAEDRYWLVVNAANREKDFAWLSGHITGRAELADISDDIAQLALQGPEAEGILTALAGEGGVPAKYYTFVERAAVAGIPCLVSRTGYTGERGYELYCGAEDAEKLWTALLAAGEGAGPVPCGLGARDTLRLEAAMPLYGHEMDETISPLETGLDFAVKLDKPDFIGRDGLLRRGEPQTTRVGVRITGRGIARENCPVYCAGRQVGHTTSGTYLPHLGGPYAMALVDRTHSAVGTVLEVEVRGRRIAGEIVPLPFYTAAK